MLNGTEIVRCVQTAIPAVKNPRWRQPFGDCGYFCCEHNGREQAIMVEVNANVVVYGYLASREVAVALYVVGQLKGEV